MSTMAEQIRSAVGRRIEQARRDGAVVVDIVSGDIVRELKLKNRTPNVCQVLASKKLQEDNEVVLEAREGPKSGQSTTMKYTYRLEHSSIADQRLRAFQELRGAGKATFAALGGGEAFIKSERQAFYRL